MAQNDANPTTSGAGTPVPDAGGDPEQQATAAMATEPGSTMAGNASGATARSADPVLPPAPADYEMPDDFENDWLGQTRQWVEDNPVLAVVAAASVGLVVGRLVMALVPEPEPPSFAERVEKRAKQLRKDAAHVADDAGEALADNLKKAAHALTDAAEAVAGKAESGFERTKDLAEVVSDAVKAAVAGVMVKKADDWMSRLRR